MRAIVILLFLAQPLLALTQNYDSLISVIYSEATDSARIKRMFDIIENDGRMNPKDAVYYHTKILEETKKHNDKVGEAVMTAELGYWTVFKVDLEAGTKMIYEALQMAEKAKSQLAAGIAYHDLALIYWATDNVKAADFFRKGLYASQAANNTIFICAATLYIGVIFMERNQLDSAMNYIQQAYTLAVRHANAVTLPDIFINLSRLHRRLGNRRVALEYLHAALQTPRVQVHNMSRSAVYLSIAIFYDQEHNFDSGLYYGNRAFETARNTLYINLADKADFLRKLYLNRNSDSALKYTNIYYSAKDSVFSMEKVQKLQLLAFEEEKRQQRIAEAGLKEKEARKHNIQYAAIAVGIITCTVVFVLLSRSIVVSTNILEFLGVTGLLVMFEFINLVIHPYLVQATNDSPLLMLLILVVIAALLVPFHHKLQRWVNTKMVEKHKKIRLAAAKKTVEALEGEAAVKGGVNSA